MEASSPATATVAGVKPRLLPGESKLEERPTSLGQQWAGCRALGGPAPGGVGEPVHRARAARGQQASWKDAATWPPGRPARRMGILDVGRQATSLGFSLGSHLCIALNSGHLLSYPYSCPSILQADLQV